MHTYGWVLKNSSQGEGFWKTLHRERGFEKPFTGRGVLKNLSQAEGFWQTLHRESGFEKPYIHTYMLSIHTYMLSIHTHIAVLKNSSQGEGFWKNPHKERGFEKSLTGRGVLKFNIHTYSLSNQLFSKVVHFKTPLPVRAFAFQQQHNSRCSEPKPLSLWGFLALLSLPRSLHALMYVCMFQTPLPVRVFVTNIPTYSLSSQHEAQS